MSINLMKKTFLLLSICLSLSVAVNSYAKAEAAKSEFTVAKSEFAETELGFELSLVKTHANFFQAVSKHCGKAYTGKVTIDTSNSPSFANKKLIMHIRKCSKTQLQIPFHVGDDSSRTWLINKVDSGLLLKHDHRHRDGSDDILTMYGGYTLTDGSLHSQSFPADDYSKQLFIDNNIPQSVGNTWQLFISPDKFSYGLIRQGMEFRVDFDLTKPITLPRPPWGAND
jgi:hypothetical protein